MNLESYTIAHFPKSLSQEQEIYIAIEYKNLMSIMKMLQLYAIKDIL